jgi:hypothetical protein
MLEELHNLEKLQTSEGVIEDFKSYIETAVKETADRHKSMFKCQNKGFEHLFAKWGVIQ